MHNPSSLLICTNPTVLQPMAQQSPSTPTTFAPVSSNPHFNANYLLGPLLGSGGFGTVHSAIRRVDGKEAAVKFIVREKVPATSWVREGTIALPIEAYILKHAHHPNIIGFLDCYQDETYVILVTDLHGGSWDIPTSMATVSNASTIYPTPTSPAPSQSLPSPMVKDEGYSSYRFPPIPSSQSQAVFDNILPSPPLFSPSPLSSDAHYNAAIRSTNLNSAPQGAPATPLTPLSPVAQPFDSPPASPAASLFQRKQSCDLFECIELYQRFNDYQARYVFRQIASAIAYLRDMGIVHRDIKDENVLIDDKFHVKLIDFGSASFINQSSDGLFLGTLQYAAPEIIEGRVHRSAESEVWSAGCCLYVMLTGESPFETLSDIRYGVPTHLATHSRHAGMTQLSHDYQAGEILSSSVLDLLVWMLEKDPRRRATLDDVFHHPWMQSL